MIYNFCSAAIDDLRRNAKSCDLANQPKSACMLRTIANLIEEEAIKFALPDGGRLFQKPFTPSDADLLHLPYPVIALEYSMSDAHPTTICPEDLGCIAPKRICLAFDSHEHDGIMVIPAWFDETIRTWVTSITGVFIPRDQSRCPDPHGPILCSYHPILLPEIWDERIPEAGGIEEAKRLEWLDCKDEVNNLLIFLLALSCTNVRARDSEDERILKKVNAKRIRKGKRPIFSYKILEIIVPRETSKNQDAAEGEHSRNSPRVHLRRGHVRRLTNGKRVWVNACVVGKKNEGMIHKDYRVVSKS